MDIEKTLKKYKNQSFTVRQAKDKGVSKYELVNLARSGKLQRIHSGLYAFPEYAPTSVEENVLDFLKVMPHAVVGYDTALALYGLQDQLSDEIHLVVPSSNVPKRKVDGVRFFQVRSNFDHLEISIIKELPVTSINQTIVDLLRIKRPMSEVIEIFYKARDGQKLGLSISKIKKLGKIFRTTTKIHQLLEAIE